MFRCKIGTKSLCEQILDEAEELKLLQYEEAIEAIDLVIEYKNQVICGRSSAVSSELPMERFEDRTDKMLMERFKKLNTFEMRVLLQR